MGQAAPDLKIAAAVLLEVLVYLVHHLLQSLLLRPQLSQLSLILLFDELNVNAGQLLPLLIADLLKKFPAALQIRKDGLVMFRLFGKLLDLLFQLVSVGV